MTKENACPAVGAAEQAQKSILAGNDLFQANSSTSGERAQGLVEALLARGEENATPSRQLARMAGFRSVRELQSEIARERENGALILSTCRGGGGYYLPADGAAGRREISEFIATLQARAQNTFAVLRSAKAALQQVDGQMAWNEWEC